jgi:hypothetical protein
MNTVVRKLGQIQASWDFGLDNMPSFDKAMQRVYAWYENEIIDRAPIRFMAHNAFLESETDTLYQMNPEQRKKWWFDAELQVENFSKSFDGRTFTLKLSLYIFPTSDQMFTLDYTVQS